MNARRSVFPLFLSFAGLGAGLFFASAHPVAPVSVTFLFLGALLLFQWRPKYGLYALPLFLPLLNFSPWTGWQMVDEFDLLVLAVASAGYFRMYREGGPFGSGNVFHLVLALTVLLIVQSVNNFPAQEVSWFSGYTSSLNGFRVGKSLLWIVLLYPLLAKATKGPLENKSTEAFLVACVLGSGWVVLAVFWERVFYPGLFDLSTPYRTVGLFWEMHHGGAALDAYLVLLVPLLVWAWRATVSSPGRLFLGVFVLAFVYVCLTTFSRGVIGASTGSVIVLSVLLVWRRLKGENPPRVISPVSILVVILVVLEVVLVFGADSFMGKRLSESERDFGGRLQHWKHGIGLLKTPGEWLFGIGLGNLPARLTQGEGGLALSGSYSGHEVSGQRSMVIRGPSGPGSAQGLGGLYALTQRVDLIPGKRYRFAMDVRSEQRAVLLVQVCAQHLLYPAQCQSRMVRLLSRGWQHLESRLSGAPFPENSWNGLAHGLVKLSVLTEGAKVELANLALSVGTDNLLSNPQFLEGGAYWLPVASSYFLPWHIDNVYLEIMIETGLVGLLAFIVVVLLIICRLFHAYKRGSVFAPYFLSCLAGLMALGLVVSVFDMPRVATLLGLLMVWAWQASFDITK